MKRAADEQRALREESQRINATSWFLADVEVKGLVDRDVDVKPRCVFAQARLDGSAQYSARSFRVGLRSRGLG